MSRPTNETPSVKSYNPSPGGRLHVNKANMQTHTNDDAFHLAHIFPRCGQSQGARPFSMNVTAHWVSPRDGSTLRHPLSLVMTSCHDLCLDVQSMSPAVLPPIPTPPKSAVLASGSAPNAHWRRGQAPGHPQSLSHFHMCSQNRGPDDLYSCVVHEIWKYLFANPGMPSAGIFWPLKVDFV